MLKGISPVIGTELLTVLHQMGHGDELVLSDAFFPAYRLHKRVIRADGIKIDMLLDGILPLFTLDAYDAAPVKMMAAVSGDTLDPSVEKRYRSVIERYYPETPATGYIERFAFYDRAKDAFAVVITGETVKYGNLIIKKGVIPVD